MTTNKTAIERHDEDTGSHEDLRQLISQLSGGASDSVAAEAVARIAGDNAEAQARTTAIAAEAQARTQADNAEALARQNADNAEAQAREQADDLLDTNKANKLNISAQASQDLLNMPRLTGYFGTEASVINVDTSADIVFNAADWVQFAYINESDVVTLYTIKWIRNTSVTTHVQYDLMYCINDLETTTLATYDGSEVTPAAGLTNITTSTNLGWKTNGRVSSNWDGFLMSGTGDAVSVDMEDLQNLMVAVQRSDSYVFDDLYNLIRSQVALSTDYVRNPWYGQDTSNTANTISIKVDPSYTAHVDGAIFFIKVNTTNTSTAVNLVINDLPAVPVVKALVVAPVVGTLAANTQYGFQYNATVNKYRIISGDYDAYKFNGELPSYYGKATDVSANTLELTNARQSTLKGATYANLDGRLEAIEKDNVGRLATSYTYSSNKEVSVTSVDTATDTFTSEGHGLTAGTQIYPTINQNVGATYPMQVYAGGVTQRRYYVINPTTDTFQISISSGGSALDLTDNATLDLTKWHFEAAPPSSLVISGLPSLKRMFVRIFGKTVMTANSNLRLYPSAPVSWDTATWIYPTGTFGSPRITSGISGTFQMALEYYINSETPMIRVIGSSADVKNDSAAELLVTNINTTLLSREPSFVDNEITAITLYHGDGFTNGFKVEVYTA